MDHDVRELATTTPSRGSFAAETLENRRFFIAMEGFRPGGGLRVQGFKV